MNITIIGIGRLGFPLMLSLLDAGHNIIGIDSNISLVESINNGSFYSKEPGVMELYKKLKEKILVSTDLKKGIDHSSVLLIFVPTPTGIDNPYDVTILSSVLSKINNYKVSDKFIVINCTVAPGYCNNVGDYLLKDCINTRLSYSPEFVAQGQVIEGFLESSISLIGVSDDNEFVRNKEIEIISNIHKTMSPKSKICVMNRLEAEITKLSINTFLSLKIAYGNFINDICNTVSCDGNKVLEVVGSDRRIGHSLLKPGYGFGGPCLPRDARALSMIAKDNNINTLFLDTITLENKMHHERMAKNILDSGKLEFNYCTYKYPCEVDMIDNSPTLEVANNIKKLTENPIILRDRESVLKLIIEQYGNKFIYESSDNK